MRSLASRYHEIQERTLQTADHEPFGEEPCAQGLCTPVLYVAVNLRELRNHPCGDAGKAQCKASEVTVAAPRQLTQQCCAVGRHLVSTDLSSTCKPASAVFFNLN